MARYSLRIKKSALKELESVATKADRRRRLLSDAVEVAYNLVLPAAPGAEQSTFDAVVSDLSTAMGMGGAIVSGLASLGLGTVDTDAFVAPATFDPVDSADTWCVK